MWSGRYIILEVIYNDNSTYANWSFYYLLVPRKTRILLWKARLDRVPTKTNLLKRNIQLEDESCTLCDGQSETIDHLLVECSKSDEVRRAVNRWWNVFTFPCDNLNELLGSDFGSSQKEICNLTKTVIKHAYIWEVWKGRNDAIFNQVPFNTHRVANLIQYTAFNWLVYRSSFGCSVSWTDWCCNPLIGSL